MGLTADSLKPLRSQLYSNAAYLWLGEISFSLLGFAFWTVIARLYSPEEVGIGGATITSLALLAQVAPLGLGYVLIRFISEYGGGAPRLLAHCLVVSVAASLLAGLAFLSTVPLWSQDLRDLLWHGPVQAISLVLFVVFASVMNLLRFTFVAYRRGIFVLVQRLSLGVLRIPMAALLGGLGSAFGIIAGHGLAVMVSTVLVGLAFLPRCTGQRRLPLALDVWRLAPVMPYALSNLASQVLTVLMWQLLPLLVIALAGAESAGYFYVAWAVSGLVMVMTQQLSLSLFAEGSHNTHGLRSQAWGALLVGVALSSFFAALLYFLGDFILLLFGREYVVQSSGVLKVLAAATPLAALTHVYLGIQRLLQRLVSLVTVSAVVMVSILGVTAVLVPRLGIVGAGYGVLVGYGVGALLSISILPYMMSQVRPAVTES